MKRSAWDWLASLFVPGWTQLMYLRFAPAGAFLVAALVVWAWVLFGAAWWYGILAHIAAALHGVALVQEYRRRYGSLDVPDPRLIPS